MTAATPNRFTSHANCLLFACVFSRSAEVPHAKDWAAIVEMAERDPAFRLACMRIKSSIANPALARLQAICRSVDAKLACLDALA